MHTMVYEIWRSVHTFDSLLASLTKLVNLLRFALLPFLAKGEDSTKEAHIVGKTSGLSNNSWRPSSCNTWKECASNNGATDPQDFSNKPCSISHTCPLRRSEPHGPCGRFHTNIIDKRNVLMLQSLQACLMSFQAP